MVMGMITPAHQHCAERLSDGSVLTAVVDIAGACHEVLPPRKVAAAGLLTQRSAGAVPP